MPVLQTISSGQSATEFPVSPTGEPFRFALVRGDTTVFSDSVTDLVAAVIPGYGQVADDEDALLARWRCAAATATEVQQLMAAGHDLDPAVESEETLTAIFTDRADTLPDGVLTGSWTHDVPLVLLATDYEPFTPKPRPQGNIIWVDSSTERSFLGSLVGLGVAQFYAHEPRTGSDPR